MIHSNKIKTNIISIFVFALLPLFISCDKYLDVPPKGKRLLVTVNDYDLLLNNRNSVAASIPNELNMLEDNTDVPTIIVPLSGTDNFVYTFQPQLSVDPNAQPVIWKDLYESIYYYNTVINGIDVAIGSTEQQKKSIKAEALLCRALNYLYLVNLYGKSYNASTAKTDLAVPFVIAADVNVAIPGRSTVEEIYSHIFDDLNLAIPDLPNNNNTNRFRGSKAAGYSVLARTYLYRSDFVNAAKYAQLALDNGPNQVLDYSTMSGSENIPNLAVRPNTFFARFFKNNYFTVRPTLNFLSLFSPKDLRLDFWYSGAPYTTRGTPLYLSIGNSYADAYPNCGTSVEEMRLILAEVAARANDLTTAINQLDLIRKCRFRPADYQKFQSSIKEDVLKAVLKERNLELAYNGFRWFDMRRLDTEGRMPTVNRYAPSGAVLATLEPGSPRYTLQIPLQVLIFNPSWQQNP